MIPGDLLSFINYFQTWANDHADNPFFLFGSVEKGITYAQGFPDFRYPLVWLEQPSIVTDDNDAANINDVYLVGITVVSQAPLDNYPAQVQAYADSLAMLHDLQRKLKTDEAYGRIVCEIRSQRKEPVSQLWLDSHYGYRLEVEIAFNINHLIHA